MEKELQNFKIARFALDARYDDIGETSIEQLKRHLLDALGSLIHAGNKPAIQKLLRQLQVMGEGGKCKVPLIESKYGFPASSTADSCRYP